MIFADFIDFTGHLCMRNANLLIISLVFYTFMGILLVFMIREAFKFYEISFNYAESESILGIILNY